MDGNTELFQGREQALDAVGEQDGGGGIGQQEGARNEHHNADHHEKGGAHALQRDGEHPDLEQHMLAGGVEEVEYRGEHKDEHHWLQSTHDGLDRYSGDADERGQNSEQKAVGHETFCHEQGHDIQGNAQNLGAGVHAVQGGIAGEVLAQGNVFQRHVRAPPLP